MLNTVATARALGGDLLEPDDETKGHIVDFLSMSESELQDQAANIQDELDKKLEARQLAFENALVFDLEYLRRYCSFQKGQRNLPARFDRNDRRVGNKLRLAFKDNWDVDETWEDGWASMGIGPGLTAQAVLASESYQNMRYFERGKRWFSASGLGRRQDNKNLAASVEDLTDYWTRLGKFERVGRHCNFQVPAQGTAFLRYYPWEPLEYKPDAVTGAMTETRAELRPFFRVWPIRDIECTNIDLQNAEDQQGVFYITRSCNVNKLSQDEATYSLDLDATGNVVGMPRVAGRFFNLGKLREVRIAGQKKRWGGSDINSVSPSNHEDTISNQPMFDLIEYRGNIAPEICDLMTPALAMKRGIDVGMKELDDIDLMIFEDEEGAQSVAERRFLDHVLAEFRARLARIAVFSISYLAPHNAYMPTGKTSYLVELNINPAQRNELYVKRYCPDGEELFGNSVSDLGEALENLYGAIMNAHGWLALHAAQPSAAVDVTALTNPIREQAKALIRPKNIIQKLPNRKLADFMELMELHSPPDIHIWLENVKAAFFALVRTLPAIMGNAQANTLGQDQINSVQAQTGQDDVLLSNSKEDYRMLSDMHEDFYRILGRDKYFDMLQKIGGYNAADVKEQTSAASKITDHLYFDHPTAFGRDTAVVSQEFDRKVSVYGPLGKLDPVNVTREGMAFVSTDPDDLMIQGYEALPPEQIVSEIANGNFIAPDPNMELDQVEQQLVDLVPVLQQVESGNTQVGDENMSQEQLENLQQGLSRYLHKATVVRDLAIGREQQMMAMQAGGGAGGPMPQSGANKAVNIQTQANKPNLAGAAA